MKRFLASSIAVVMLSGLIVAENTVNTADAQMQLRGYVTRTMRAANRQFQVGKWETAEQIYTRSVKRYPNNSMNHAGLGIVQAELFKLGAAEKSAERALQLNPKNAYAHVALGVVYRNRTASSDMTYRNQREELLNKSIKEFKRALELDPNNPDAYNKLGEVYRMQGQLAEAEQAFDRALELDYRFSEALANKGTVLAAQGKTDSAIDYYKKAIKQNTKNHKAHFYLGEALAKQGKYHDAYNALNTSLYQNRNSEMVYTKMGEVLQAQGNESAAIAKYREAIRIKPEYIPAYQQLATLFDNRGDGELAMAELKSALNANPKLEQLKIDLGRMSLAVDKPEQALQYYDEVLRNDPTNAEALQGLSQAYLKSADRSAGQGILGGNDKYVDAEIAIGRALQANPNDMNLHLAMLKISKLSGKPGVANEQLRYIISQPAYTPAQRLAKAEAYFDLGKYQESDELMRGLLNESQGNVEQQLALANTAQVQGNLAMAQESYRRVLNTQPQNLKAQRGLQRINNIISESDKDYNLAEALNSRFSKQKRTTAKDFYIEALATNPRKPDAHLELAKIYNREDQYGQAIFEYESYLNLSPQLTDRERERIVSKINRLKTKLQNQQTSISTYNAPRAAYR